MDPTPATLFESYEQDFQHIIESIKDKLQGSGKDQRGEQRKAALRKVEIELDEGDDIVSQLELEIQGIPQSIRSKYTPRLKQAKADLSKYKRLSKDVHARAARTDLLGSSRRGGTSASDDPYANEEINDRTRLLAATETLDDGSRRLNDSTRIALETESQGADILTTLRRQREQIEGTRETLNKADTNIDRASGTIKKMIRQMYKQRVVIGAIIIVLVLVVGLILYLKLRR